MTPDAVAQLLGTWGYPAYVLLLLATALGSPVTEDLLLLTGGYLVSAGIFSWPVALPLSFACVMASDLTLYTIGRRLRSHSLSRSGLVRRLVRPAHLRIATRWFGRFGDPVVFIARLVPGTRLLVFLTAGVRAMPPGRFLLMDGMASVIYVPTTMWLGVKLGEQQGRLDRALGWVGDRVLLLIGLAAAVLLVRHLWRSYLERLW
ncbi:MAG: DedA family protein [Vicinamibacterales bacterium]|nr:DedA family protein [Vicinamibacterales bacterium]